MQTHVFRQGAIFAAICSATLLTGCALSGLDAKGSFSCRRDSGRPCLSLSDIASRREKEKRRNEKPQALPTKTNTTPPLPLERTTFTHLWIAPWVDSNGVFYEGQSCYIVETKAHWSYAQSRKILRAKGRVLSRSTLLKDSSAQTTTSQNQNRTQSSTSFRRH